MIGELKWFSGLDCRPASATTRPTRPFLAFSKKGGAVVPFYVCVSPLLYYWAHWAFTAATRTAFSGKAIESASFCLMTYFLKQQRCYKAFYYIPTLLYYQKRPQMLAFTLQSYLTVKSAYLYIMSRGRKKAHLTFKSALLSHSGVFSYVFAFFSWKILGECNLARPRKKAR